MEGAVIVVTTKEASGLDGRFSLWAGPGEAEHHIRGLMEGGTPPDTIRVYRARPLALRRPAPIAA